MRHPRFLAENSRKQIAAIWKQTAPIRIELARDIVLHIDGYPPHYRADLLEHIRAALIRGALNQFKAPVLPNKVAEALANRLADAVMKQVWVSLRAIDDAGGMTEPRRVH